MSKEIKIAGSISFGGKRLNVYGDLDAPLFKAKDISHAIGYMKLFLKRKQIALMTGANLRFASPLRDKSFRNED